MFETKLNIVNLIESESEINIYETFIIKVNDPISNLCVRDFFKALMVIFLHRIVQAITLKLRACAESFLSFY